jgi:undecaprenyl diphosphate synthase
MNLPEHIVIIPDGNRRWARKKGLAVFYGHEKGAEGTKAVLQTALDLKIPHITLWGSSVDNITKRSKSEVKFLMAVFEKYFKKLLGGDEIYKNQVKVEILGRWRELFPAGVKKPMEEVIKKTAHYSRYHLTFLMGYSGIDEMTSAIQRIANISAEGGSASGEKNFKIDGKIIKDNLWTRDLPAVDLVIRTGGEPHWSAGLMMWDVANAQLYFTKTLWPDFSKIEFRKAVLSYAKTERRLGK